MHISGFVYRILRWELVTQLPVALVGPFTIKGAGGSLRNALPLVYLLVGREEVVRVPHGVGSPWDPAAMPPNRTGGANDSACPEQGAVGVARVVLSHTDLRRDVAAAVRNRRCHRGYGITAMGERLASSDKRFSRTENRQKKLSPKGVGAPLLRTKAGADQDHILKMFKVPGANRRPVILASELSDTSVEPPMSNIHTVEIKETSIRGKLRGVPQGIEHQMT